MHLSQRLKAIHKQSHTSITSLERKIKQREIVPRKEKIMCT
jgi:hypothetical protein